MLSFVCRVEQAGVCMDIWYDEECNVFETMVNGTAYNDADMEELIFDVVALEADQSFGATP